MQYRRFFVDADGLYGIVTTPTLSDLHNTRLMNLSVYSAK
jgi:hypothetical protein